MNNPIDFLTCVLAVCVAYLIWSMGIKRLLVDSLRERLFELRADLFHLGSQSKLSFNDPAYRHIEMLLCGLIRHAHTISFLSYVASFREIRIASQEKDYVNPAQQLARNISLTPADAQEAVQRILESTRFALLVYMTLSSAPFFVIAMTFFVARKTGLVENAKEKLSMPIEQDAYRFERVRHVRLQLARV